MRSVITFLGVAALVLAGPSRTRADFINDGTFNNADWEFHVGTNLQGSSPSASQNTGDGNPAPSRLDTVFQNFSTNADLIRAFSFYVPTTYTPSTQGAMEGVRFAFDTKGFQGAGGTTAQMGFALLQNNTYYYQTTPADLSPLSHNTWVTFTSGNLAPDAFTRDPASPGAGGATPDFSTAGGTIKFGYFVAYISPANPNGHVGVTNVGVDNFAADPVTNPEPSGLALLGAAGAGFVAVALRRRLRRGEAKPQTD